MNILSPDDFPSLREKLRLPSGTPGICSDGPSGLSAYEEIFRRYALEEKKACRRDPAPMDLKASHTFRVLQNATHIAGLEHFPATTARACRIAALFHDLSRFEQYRLWGTFRDGESCDHGALSAWLLRETEILKGEPSYGPILTAISLHNAISLPEDLEGEALTVARTVRDADRLDIMLVMDRHLSEKKDSAPDVVVPMPDDPGIFSQAVIDAVAGGGSVRYSDILSVNDFRLVVAGWFFLMSYPASRALAARAGHARHLAEDLPPPYAAARDRLLAELDAALPTR